MNNSVADFSSLLFPDWTGTAHPTGSGVKAKILAHAQPNASSTSMREGVGDMWEEGVDVNISSEIKEPIKTAICIK